MTFEADETSKENGRPFELYEFSFGPRAEDKFKYTNSVKAIEDFQPIPIKRDAYKTTGKAERDQMNFTVPARSEIAKMILPYPPPYTVYVTIWQGHHATPADRMVVWIGRLLSNAFEAGEVVLTCESTLISLKRQGVRRRWQVGCPLRLYSQGVGQCNAERDDFTVETEVVDVINDDPILPANWWQPFQREQFRNGMISWESPLGVEYRSIRRSLEDRVVFNGQLRGIAVGDTVKMILGCNHKRVDCEEVFDNIKNYGGDDWLPLQNPVRNANFW